MGLAAIGPYRYAHGPVVARTREQARVAGLLGAVAQLVERLLCKEEVRSSSLLGSTAPRTGGVRRMAVQLQLRAGIPPAGGRSRSETVSIGPFEPAHVHVMTMCALERASGAP